ncbi:class I SAM-dependent methyltransferase [Imhoffiella purpurea]|uniref:Putative methyltransferase n=1 Tax=Imhoffiella purpurea TaxID=1249627 RepID=W9VDI3_9GAMM|nr:methyltransferase domain-containing protein [Imhoffiella purpurea]EXJ14102.1 putative methyltransferase [Imhoffiella purpurea]
MPIELELRRLIPIVALLLLPLAALAESPAVDPSLNNHYRHANPQRWQDIFEREGREVFDRRDEILRALEIRPGMRVADVGAGTGLFTLPFARSVGPTGIVYAVDISESFITSIGRRAAAEGLTQVAPVLNRQKEVALPDSSVDLVFICDTYHHFEYPETILDSIHAALAPGGLLAIIDYRREPGTSSDWILSHVRAGRKTVIAEVERAGFAFIDEPLRLRENYFIRFRKR